MQAILDNWFVFIIAIIIVVAIFKGIDFYFDRKFKNKK